MSLRQQADGFAYGGFPRVSGDEPAIAAECEAWGLFSPRERG